MLVGMPGRFGVLSSVVRSPVLAPLELAYLVFAFGEWSTWVAVIVYAYVRGGAGEAGIIVCVELAPSVLLAPAVAALGDRFARDRVLLGTYAAQAAVMAAMAITLLIGSGPLLIYPLAVVTATLVALSRPIHAALMPEVVESPDELTAANVVSGMAESAGTLIGPLGAAILLGIGGPATVFVVAAAGALGASLAVLWVARRRRTGAGAAAPETSDVDRSGDDRSAEPVRSWRATGAQLVAGLAAILADGRLRAVVLIATWATLLVGAMDILYAVLAIDLMGLGGQGVGFVGALGGVGAILGSVAGLLLVGRERLGVALAASAIAYGCGIAAIAVVPGSVAAGILLVLAGIGSGLTYVGAQTLIHRLAGDDVMSRVFGVLQGLMMGASAVGAIAVPIVIGVVGNRAVFAVAGLSLPIVLALVGRAIVQGDRLDATRAAELRLLRGVPMLAPVSGPVLERLAGAIVRSRHPAGSIVVREGDHGDRFYVVETGSLQVSVNGRPVRQLGSGGSFGEIALIRDVPRTATVTAIEDSVLLGIDHRPFVDALGGQPRSRTIAHALIDDRLATDVPRF